MFDFTMLIVKIIQKIATFSTFYNFLCFSTDLTALLPKDAIMMLQTEIIAIKEFNQSNQAGLEALKEVEKLKESLLSDNKNNLPPDVKLGQV